MVCYFCKTCMVLTGMRTLVKKNEITPLPDSQKYLKPRQNEQITSKVSITTNLL